MQLQQMFDSTQVNPEQGSGQLPVGKHKVHIIDEHEKPAKSGDGAYVEFILEILDGPNQGLTGAYRLNLQHKNPDTVQIAYRQLSALCHVTGIYRINDTTKLQRIPFMVEVAPQTDDKYTEIKRVFDINGNPPKQGQMQQNQAMQGQQMMQQSAQQPMVQQQPAWSGQPAQAPVQQQPAWGQPQQQPVQEQPPVQQQQSGWQQQQPQGQQPVQGQPSQAPWAR